MLCILQLGMSFLCAYAIAVYICIFSHISAKCAYCIFSCIKWHFRQQFLYYLCFYYLFLLSFIISSLDHLFVNRMAPCMRLDLCGTRCCSWFPAVLYHISAYFHRIFGVYAIRIFLIKMPHKTYMPNEFLFLVVTLAFSCLVL